MTMRIGITGGIGSGKSVVSQLLRILGEEVYDADSQAKRLMHDSPDVRNRLVHCLGNDIYENGTINRQSMASRIFSSPGLLKKVNEIVHPAVKDDFVAWSDKQNRPVVFIESAILFESGFNSVVDKVWLVTAPAYIRKIRVMARNGWTEEEIEKRMSAQMDDDSKKILSDVVIVNDDRCALIPQLLKQLQEVSQIK